MPKKLIHTSPKGALDINGVGRNIAPGEPFDVPDDIAATLLAQPDLYQEATSTKVSDK